MIPGDPAPQQPRHLSAAVRVSHFVRHLREAGFRLGVGETLDALHWLEQGDVTDVNLVRNSMAALFCRNRDEWGRFPMLFDQFWLPGHEPPLAAENTPKADPRMGGTVRAAGAFAGLGHSVDKDLSDSEETEGAALGGAGRNAALTHSDFRFLTDARAAEQMLRLSEQLARNLRKRLQRRYARSANGSRIHFRRTLRRSLAVEGLALNLIRQRPRRRLPRLLLLLDVSHSMAQYSRLLARFTRGLVQTLPDTEAFVFHTELHRVTEIFRESDLETLRLRLEGMTQLWFGGTRIAESLKALNEGYGAQVIGGRTIVMIMSDGFDTDAPQELAEELSRIRRRSRRVLWMNPMAGRAGYQPDAAGLAPALAHVDRMLPAHSVDSLAALADELTGF